MIEIVNVCPTVRESRTVTRGWGSVHWICLVPTYAFLVGFLSFGLLAVSLAGDRLPGGLFGGILLGSWAVWALGLHWQRLSLMKEAHKAPTGRLPWRWRIDRTGLEFDNGLQSNRLDWRAVKAVRDEKDRFLFLVSPFHNPVLPKRLLDDQQLSELRGLIAGLRAGGRLGAGLDGSSDRP